MSKKNITYQVKKLPVQEFLEKHSLNELENMHGVGSRVAGQKFSLNYKQIKAVDGDPVSQDCRGLVLVCQDWQKNIPLTDDVIVGKTEILALPMKRFFNHGQGACAPVDLNDPHCRFYEKLDGTMCLVYHDPMKDVWCVATRSVSDADLPIDGFGTHTFASLFQTACEKQTGMVWDAWTKLLAHQVTYCFELMTPYNQVVVAHEEYKIALLTMRDRVSHKEVDHNFLVSEAAILKVPTAPCHEISDLSALVEFVNSRDGLNYEGVVVCDSQHRRMKVKSVAYVAASRAKDVVTSSPRNLLELILLEQLDDIVPLLLDEHKTIALAMQEKVRNYFLNFDTQWAEVKAEVDDLGPMSDHNHRREFVRAVTRHGLWLNPAMMLYQGKSKNFAEWVTSRKDQTNKKEYPAGFLDSFLRELQG